MTPIPVFDGHNDLLSCLMAEGDPNGATFFAGRAKGHLDLPRAKAGGFAGGFFAIWPSYDAATAPDPMARRREFATIDPAHALRETLAQAAILQRMTRARPDAIRLVTSVAAIREAQAAGAVAAILHLEGAEAIGADLDALHVLHAAGLRGLGPVWSRSNLFAHGVPFDFPASPDTGPGLTEAGRRLVAECESLGILVDLSHLNEAGFWDIARQTARPLVATHSGAHAVTPATRNLTDRQLAAIAESGGLVGLNFACQFLRPDGIRADDTPAEAALRHLDHLLGKLGEDGVAFGSDFDGALMPQFIGDTAGLPMLIEAMRKAGYGEALIRKITFENWMRVLTRIIG